MIDNCPNHYTCIGCKHAQIIERTLEHKGQFILVKVLYNCPACSISNIETNYILS